MQEEHIGLPWQLHLLQGSGTNEFVKEVQQYFTKVVRMRVEASRSQSREFFCVGLGRKQPK